MTLTGLGAFAGTAAAWDDLDADFRGCSEVWILPSENDLQCQDEAGDEFTGDNDECPLLVSVVVASGHSVECHRVEVTRENATTIPGKYGDQAVVKYEASWGEKILGIIGLSPSQNPVCADLIVNDNHCTKKPFIPSISDADCVPCPDAGGDDDDDHSWKDKDDDDDGEDGEDDNDDEEDGRDDGEDDNDDEEDGKDDEEDDKDDGEDGDDDGHSWKDKFKDDEDDGKDDDDDGHSWKDKDDDDGKSRDRRPWSHSGW